MHRRCTKCNKIIKLQKYGQNKRENKGGKKKGQDMSPCDVPDTGVDDNDVRWESLPKILKNGLHVR